MTLKVIPSIEALTPYEAGKPLEQLARELGVTDAIKLASNENPYGPSPKVVDALRAAAPDVHRYPDSTGYRLRHRLAERLKVSPEEIVLGNGSNELLELLVRTFCTRESHVVFAEPSFVVYRMASMAQGVPFTAVPLRDQTHDLEALARAVTPATRLVFIANPNNPTGTFVTRARLTRFLEEIPADVIVALDEAYSEYADAEDYPDGLTLRDRRRHLVVLRTFSKIHGLAALRVGYAVAPTAVVQYMNRVRAPFNVSSLAQEAAIAALDDPEHEQRCRAANRAERERVTRALSELGVTVVPSQANFLFIDLGRPARPVYEALLRRGVIVRPFTGLENNLRVTLGTPDENERFLKALAEVSK